MKRLKGPEIKLPKLKRPEKVKAPKFLGDLYRDLDERHLLPVVAILVVAIIAIPLLLSGSSDSEAGGAAAEGSATASAAPGAKPNAVLVAKATPRLRDYRRRLQHLQPKDPFKPHYESNEDEAAASASPESSEGDEGTAGTETAAPAPVEPENESPSGGTSPGEAPSPNDPGLTFFSYAIDVRVVPVSSGEGNPSKAEPTVRHDLPPLVMLPSRDTPALTYIGQSRDGKKAMMLVSNEVTALFGDSKCVVGSQACQLLALEPGLPETVVFGPQARTYRIELLKMQLEYSDHLNRAALGKPKHPGGGNGNSGGRTSAPGKSG